MAYRSITLGSATVPVIPPELIATSPSTTKGQVAATAEDIWIKERLILITAKIRGENSGGPVIASDGSIVAVSVSQTMGDGEYDDLDYGTAIPINYVVNEIISAGARTVLDVSEINFVNMEQLNCLLINDENL